MKHLNGKYDLTVDDIYEIREEVSKMFETMLNEGSKKFNERKERALQQA